MKGRPRQIPDPSNNAILLDRLIKPVHRILKMNGAPPTWGQQEALAVLGVVQCHQNMTAPGVFPVWSRMWVEAGDTIIDSLQQIRDAVKKQLRSPEYLVAVFHAKHPAAWKMTAEEFAKSIKVNKQTVSKRVVEHARELLKSGRIFIP